MNYISNRSTDHQIIIIMALLGKHERDEIDEALSKFFFGCNIPFTVIESEYFINFVRVLNPAYKPPTRKTLSNTLLDKAYDKLLLERSELEESDGVLLIDGWKNSAANSKNVVCTVLSCEKHMFLYSWDLTRDKEDSATLQIIVNEAAQLAKEKYNVNIYSVISDNASTMVSMGCSIDFWHTTCNSHSGNLLAKSLVQAKFAEDVNHVLREFKNPRLEREVTTRGGTKMILACETRWCSYRDAFRCCLKNLHYMRQILAEGQHKIKQEVAKLLNDNEFELLLQDFLIIFDPVCNLINKCQKSDCNIADATEEWLKLEIPTENQTYTNIIQARINKVLTPIALAANMLHPVYQGRRFINNNMYSIMANDFLLTELDENGLRDLEIYKTKSGNIFPKLISKNVTLPKTFWTMAENEHPSLSKVVKKLLLLPASTADIERLFSNWSYIHSSLRNRLTPDRSAMLVDIYHSLRNKDTHKSFELTLLT